METERSRPARQDYYLAQIAAEIRRSSVTEPRKVQIEHFILKFETEEDRREKAAKSKAVWAALLGVDLNQN